MPSLTIQEEPITPRKIARASRTFCRTVQALRVREEPCAAVIGRQNRRDLA
jgi:hypothetical protein